MNVPDQYYKRRVGERRTRWLEAVSEEQDGALRQEPTGRVFSR